jgi:hypothetical protein
MGGVQKGLAFGRGLGVFPRDTFKYSWAQKNGSHIGEKVLLHRALTYGPICGTFRYEWRVLPEGRTIDGFERDSVPVEAPLLHGS